MEINGMEVELDLRYSEMNLSQGILQALNQKGFTMATPVQAGAIPCFKDWKDVIAKAPTGSGKTFAAVAKIEKSHEDRYVKLAENLSNSEVFKRAEVKVWYCRNCGHLEYGTEAPEVCPVCAHPRAYFELKAENY